MSVSVHHIAVPNPYFEGSTNTFLLRNQDSPPVLVDTGIGTKDTLMLLRRELAAHGCALNEIAVVLLTHKHIDHFGLARAIQDESNATVYVHADDWQDVVAFDEHHEKVSRLYLNAMHRWGIPDEIIPQIAQFRTRFSALARSVPEAERLNDKQVLRFGKIDVSILHTPGHTRGSVCFLFDGKLFTGDHLLPTYTPNIGATDVTSGRLLGRFGDSLRKILVLPNSEELEIYPGHGRPWTNPHLRIKKILEHHTERTERILRILADGQAHTAFEIAQELFGSMKEHHVLLGSGEVYAHLEELQSRGCAEFIESNRWKCI